MQNDAKITTALISLREHIDEYTGSIQALQSFQSLSTWDKVNNNVRSDCNYSFGRRMTTSTNNLVVKSNIVTPDAVIQVGVGTGFVVEVKYSLSSDRANWEDNANQLLKYCDDLIGWWTEDSKIIEENVVLLIHWSRSIAFKEFFESWLKKNNYQINNNLCFIEFTRSNSAGEFINLRSQYGQISDNTLMENLKYGVMIPIEKVVATYGALKFNDSQPTVVEYTMAIIWQDYLNDIADRTLFDKKINGIPVNINLDSLTEELQKLFGQKKYSERDVEFPRRIWIKQALDMFIEFGLAKKLDNDLSNFDYQVFYKKIPTELFEYFSKLKIKKTYKKSDKQLELF